MTRFRQWILSLAVTLALLVPLGTSVSADPIDPGTNFSTSSSLTDTTQPGRGNAYGKGPSTATTTSDPIDPGTN